MTNNEAAKWIQLYIDLAKIDPTTGEEAYLNEDDRKTLEAMEMARDALTCNRLATNLQPCKQDDQIRRSDALGCFHDWVDRYGDVHTADEMAEYRAIEALPSAQPTLYGYNIEHLELIARILQKEDLPPERIVEALTDIGRIVEIVKDEYEEALRKAVEQWMI